MENDKNQVEENSDDFEKIAELKKTINNQEELYSSISRQQLIDEENFDDSLRYLNSQMASIEMDEDLWVVYEKAYSNIKKIAYNTLDNYENAKSNIYKTISEYETQLTNINTSTEENSDGRCDSV